MVGNLSATDADTGDTHTFALVTGSGDTDNTAFHVAGMQLQFKAGAMLNHEAKSAYSIRVRATDSGGLSVEKAFVISVTDVNEAPTDILLSSSTAADSTLGAAVGSLTTIDPEQSDTHTLTVSDNRFEVVNGILKLKGDMALDSATEGSINIDVTATDSGTPSASFTKTFTLTVTETTFKFQNPLNANDVNGDGFVSPLDALIIINFLNDGNSSLPAEVGDPPKFLDVSGDNAVSPIDALIVINFLNDASSSGEGESGAPRHCSIMLDNRSRSETANRENTLRIVDAMTFLSLGDFDKPLDPTRADDVVRASLLASQT